MWCQIHKIATENMPKEAVIKNRVGRINTAKVASLTQITTLEGFLSIALKVLN